ncbi:MAG: hypothetical protein K8S97_09875 [Anaerolineae bacterium]|nr:hypothetical protein [Anaerolineae bacterium]
MKWLEMLRGALAKTPMTAREIPLAINLGDDPSQIAAVVILRWGGALRVAYIEDFPNVGLGNRCNLCYTVILTTEDSSGVVWTQCH